MSRRCRAFAAWAALAAPASLAGAAVMTVTTLADGPLTPDGICTFREAMQNANVSPAASPDCATGGASDTIVFDVPDGTIQLTGALPNIAGTVAIVGPGPDRLTIRRDTGGSYPLFVVPSGATLHLEGLSLRNGVGGLVGMGGTVDNQGTLEVVECNIRSATAAGGIANYLGFVTISRSYIHHNKVGLFNFGWATVSNSTISENTDRGLQLVVFFPFADAPDEARESPAGCGGNYALFVRNSTVVANGVGVTDLGTDLASACVAVGETVLDNTGADLDVQHASFFSLGHNIASDGAQGLLTNTGDLVNTDPRIRALAANGRPGLPTYELEPRSPAIDAGHCDNGNLTVDQRGDRRPQGGGCDVGSFERSNAAVAGYWPLDEGAGSVARAISPFALTGSISGATWVSDPERGAALEFDGDSDFVAIPGAVTEMNLAPFAFAASVKIEAGDAGALLAKGNGDRQLDPGERQFWFGDGDFAGDGERPSFVGANAGYILSDVDVPTSGWHRVMLTFQPGAVPGFATAPAQGAENVHHLYIDDVEVGTFANYIAGFGDDPLDQVRFGWDESMEASHDFHGRLADVVLLEGVVEPAAARRINAGDFGETRNVVFFDGFKSGGVENWSPP